MYHCEGRFVRMVELSTNNDRELFVLMRNNLDEYQRLVFNQVIPEDYQNFLTILNTWFSNGKIYQFLVYRKSSGQLVGTVFFYQHDKKHGTIKLSVFFKDGERRNCCAAESMGLAIAFAYQVMNIQSILFSVYEENEHMLRIAKKLGLKQELSKATSEFDQRKLFDYELPRQMIVDVVLQKLARLKS